MMHAHLWAPVLSEMARYSCGCGACEYRARTGEIREHRSKPPREARCTARPRDLQRQDKSEIGQWNAPNERD